MSGRWEQNNGFWEFYDEIGARHVVPVRNDGVPQWLSVPGYGLLPVPDSMLDAVPSTLWLTCISHQDDERALDAGLFKNIPGAPVLPPVSGNFAPVRQQPAYDPRDKIDAFQNTLDDERSRDQLAKNYDALGGSRQTGILRPQTEDPDAGKDVPAEAIPARADEPEDPAERPLTKAILDEWMRRWV